MFEGDPKMLLLVVVLLLFAGGVIHLVGKEIYFAVNPDKKPIKFKGKRQQT